MPFWLQASRVTARLRWEAKSGAVADPDHKARGNPRPAPRRHCPKRLELACTPSAALSYATTPRRFSPANFLRECEPRTPPTSRHVSAGSVDQARLAAPCSSCFCSELKLKQVLLLLLFLVVLVLLAALLLLILFPAYFFLTCCDYCHRCCYQWLLRSLLFCCSLFPWLVAGCLRLSARELGD